ncbi:MAG: hypothetical protein Q4B63_04025 [Clostridium perfringens]|nr:hypothetical protein [Clostridium perfringens]
MADKTKKSKTRKKTNTPKGSMVLYIIGTIVAIVGIISLVDYLMMFASQFSTYLAEGYSYDTVFNSLMPSLVVQICSYIATYLGIAALLFGAGIINTKVFRILSSKTSNVNLVKEVATTTVETEKTKKTEK